MPSIEKYENLVIGSGGAGKFMAWTRPVLVVAPRWSNAEHSVARAPTLPVFPARILSIRRRSSHSPGEARNSASKPNRSVSTCTPFSAASG